MPTKLNLHRDAAGGVIYAPDPTNTVYRYTLAANTEQHFTLPSTDIPNVYGAAFTYHNSAGGIPQVYVGFNGVTATVPSGNDTVAAPLRPQVRALVGGSVISMITPDTDAILSIEIWHLIGP